MSWVLRVQDARLHWPPTEMDYRLDALDATDADLVRIRAQNRRRYRGWAPNAKDIFDEELEQHLTALALVLALEVG